MFQLVPAHQFPAIIKEGCKICGWWLALHHPGVTVGPAGLDNCHVDVHWPAWGGGGLDHDIVSGAINWDQAGGEEGSEGGENITL